MAMVFNNVGGKTIINGVDATSDFQGHIQLGNNLTLKFKPLPGDEWAYQLVGDLNKGGTIGKGAAKQQEVGRSGNLKWQVHANGRELRVLTPDSKKYLIDFSGKSPELLPYKPFVETTQSRNEDVGGMEYHDVCADLEDVPLSVRADVQKALGCPVQPETALNIPPKRETDPKKGVAVIINGSSGAKWHEKKVGPFLIKWEGGVKGNGETRSISVQHENDRNPLITTLHHRDSEKGMVPNNALDSRANSVLYSKSDDHLVLKAAGGSRVYHINISPKGEFLSEILH